MLWNGVQSSSVSVFQILKKKKRKKLFIHKYPDAKKCKFLNRNNWNVRDSQQTPQHQHSKQNIIMKVKVVYLLVVRWR